MTLSINEEDQIKSDFIALIAADDIAHEEECVRNPYSLRCWLRYLNHKHASSPNSIYFIYERAVRELPGSYKLWKQYLDLRMSHLVKFPSQRKGQKFDPIPPGEIISKGIEWEVVNNCFERALVLCNKFPVIWLMYCRFLAAQSNPTKTRRTFDKCLRSIPITQHPRVWKFYLKWAQHIGGETCVRVWKRYLKLEYKPEEFVDVCLKLKEPLYLEAAKTLSLILETPNYASPNGKSLHDLWMMLCDVVCDFAEEIDVQASQTSLLVKGSVENSNCATTFNVERVLRFGVSKFPEQSGVLWNSLAKWWLLKGELEKVRDIYEEALSKVVNVKDFSFVFDSYGEFEESLLSLYIAKANASKEQEDQNPEEALQEDLEIDLRLAKLEYLMQRRPFLANDVLLRQNPHNIPEWQNRVDLYLEKKKDKVEEVFKTAISTIHPKKAWGNLAHFISNYAKYYEGLGQFDKARKVFEDAISIHFQKVDELAELWCQYAEMEIRLEEYQNALAIMGRATAPPPHVKHPATIIYNDESLSPQSRLFKSLKLWSFYVDLEESIGTIESTRTVYDRIMELKIANPQIIINYANFLEENKYFEESYKVYERGIDAFGYPIAFDMWSLYLTRFIKRFNGTKIERVRDLFEQALDNCPSKYAKSLFLMYAKLEEEYGIAKHAMRIYSRATNIVEISDLLEIYKIYIAKAASFFGLTSTREIYEKALEQLPDHQTKEMAIRFSDMEVSLGEIDRARAILMYACPFADPKKDDVFWKYWNDFEVKYGNEDTFKEMLRMKRSVQAKLNTDVAYLSAQILHEKVETPLNPMEALERQMDEEEVENRVDPLEPLQNTKVMGFVRATTTEKKHEKKEAEDNEESNINPEEIQVEDSDDDDNDNDKERQIKRQKV